MNEEEPEVAPGHKEASMGRRQIADEEGHRWDVADDGVIEGEAPQYRLSFTRDDGTRKVRTAPHEVDQLADAELRALLKGEEPSSLAPGPDTEANRTRGYGDARD
jgi:hypothetical protein